MKKLFLTLAIIATGLAFIGCEKNTDVQEPQQQQQRGFSVAIEETGKCYDCNDNENGENIVEAKR